MHHSKKFFLCFELHWLKVCLHPLTSVVPNPILLYGAEIWTLSKVELNMLEQVHHKILRINNSLTKKLIKRIQDPMAKGLIPDLQAMLDHLNLPSISTLLDNPIKPAPWKRSVKKQLGVRAYLQFLEDSGIFYK